MDLRALRRSDTGVFVGIANADYSRAHFHSGDLQRIDAYSYTGTAAAAAAGRIAHVLGFHGPAVALDTACSSSLVAVHLAAQSLAAGDCDLALAGGVNLILTPDGHVCISRLGALSQRGRCRAFDDGADGYVRSEGCGVVLLKRLGEALDDGDPVLAVIRGSAVNHDGASAGLTVPSGPAQQQVVRKALLRAGLAPAAIDYVEAHGTGTPLGDPIELQALDAVFGPRPHGPKLRVGSVKSNLGHLESAAGIAGLIKVVLALEHGEIPPSLHFETPSRHLRWPELCLEVAGRASAWTPGAAPRRAGVSSFGITGTNAHVVLEEAPPATTAGRTPAPDGGACRLASPCLVPLSARSGGALAAWAGELRGVLAGRPERPLSDLSYTTSLRRTHLERRAVAIAGSHAELLDALAALAAGRTAPGLVCGRSRGDRKPRLAFVYSGQGGPPWALSPALAEAEPAFREAVAECERELCKLGLPPLAPALLAGAPDPGLARTDVAQPALFAVQVGLTALLAHYGIRPDAVVGHSCGELAAAWASGAVSLQQALGAVFHRGRLMQSAAGRGRMAAVSLPEAAVADRLRAYGGRVAIAALNSPTSTTVSGEPAAIDAVVRRLRDEGIACRHLAVDFAFHGPQMATAAAELTELLADLPLDAGLARVPIYSTVRAARLAGPELGPAYWGDNVRQTVRFAAAVEQLAAEGVTHFLELAPVPVLQVPLRECLDGRRGEPAGSESAGDGTAVLSVLQRSRGDRHAFLEALAILHCEGYDWDWRRLHPQPGRLVALPSYAWQRRRCWIDGFPARPEGGSAAAATAQPPAAADPGAGAAAYLVAWQPLAPAVAEPAAAGGSRRPGEPWLVLANPASPTARTLHQRLEAAGRECLTVPPGQGDLARLVGGAAELAGVLFLWGCDETRAAAAGGSGAATAAAGCDAAVTAEALRSSREGALAGAVELVQALASRAWRRPPRLWMVTCGAQQALAEDRTLDLPHAGLWGLGRVIANEHPELRCTRVDLAACPAAAEIDHLAALLLDDGAAPVAAAQGPAAPPERAFEPELAMRGHVVLGARLQRPAALAAVRPLPVRAEASYLIAGGCGALGLQIAAWLVARGARTLCLLGRRGAAPAAAVPALEALRRRGARIELVACDLADSVQVARALREVGDRLPPLAGVVHAAGVLEDATLARLRRDSLERVAAPKVEGAWNLHASTRRLDLDFFVLLSSAAALLGAPGQAAYVAANSFLDALARHRAALGLPSLSIALGPVTLGAGGPGPAAAEPAAAEPAGAGMAAALAANRLDDQGLGWLTAADLTAGLESLWQSGMPHLGLLRFDAPRWLDHHPAASASYLSALLPGGAGTRGRVGNAGSAGPAGDIGSLAADPPPLLLALTALAGHPDRLRSAVAAELLDILSQVSKTPVEEIDPEAPLRELGIDSLMTLAIRDHIARRFGSVVPATSFWAHPTVSRYARYLIAELQLDRPDATATAGAAAAAADDSGSWKGLCLEPEPALHDLHEELARKLDQYR
jgi:acyl transferase domain-containing protein/acyl carrier protein